MTKKLFLYQFKETWRLSKWSYLTLLGLVIMSFVFSLLNIKIVSSIFSIFSILTLIAVLYFNQALAAINDYRNFYGDRSYFMQAIPASPKEVYLSRFLHYVLVILIAFFAIATTVFLQIITIARLEGANITLVFAEIKIILSMVPNTLIYLFFISSILSLITNAFYFMFIVSFGSDQKLHKLSFAGPIVLHVATTFIMQILGFITTIVFPLYYQVEATSESQGYLQVQFKYGGITEYLFSVDPDANAGIIPLGWSAIFILMLIFFPLLDYWHIKYRTSIR